LWSFYFSGDKGEHMKRLLLAAAVLLCAIGSRSYAQLTTVTASHILMGGSAVPTGTVTFAPVSVMGLPIAFSQAGGGLNGPTAFSCSITAGAIASGCQIPDSALTTPANILYSVQITNTATTPHTAFTLQQVAGITGATWALDSYGPPAQTTGVQAVMASVGATLPSTCVMPSVFTLTTGGGTFYFCVGGVYIAVGNGNVTYGTTAGTAAQGNDSRITGAAQKSANLTDLASASAARTALGLGSAALSATSAFDPAGAAATAQAAAEAASVSSGAAAAAQAAAAATAQAYVNSLFAAPPTLGSATPGVVNATSIVTVPDGVHAQASSWAGNTVEPLISSSHVHMIGPNIATFTAYGVQWPSVGPTGNQAMFLGTPDGNNVSQISFAAVAATLTQAQCLAATTVSIPCNAYQGNFTALGNSGTTGTITLYTSNAQAGAAFQVCPGLTTDGIATTGGTATMTINWTSPGTSGTNTDTISQSLTSYGSNANCAYVVTKANSSFSFVVTASGVTAGTAVWETNPVITRLY
jgi:hypothetical protein